MLRISAFIFLTFCSLRLLADDRVVQMKFANGTDHVVYYYQTLLLTKVLVKQEVFFENGKLEYSGEWKYGKEHGEWIYYHSNGQLKAKEYWYHGKETGTWKEYDEQGKLIRTQRYKSGVLIETLDY